MFPDYSRMLGQLVIVLFQGYVYNCHLVFHAFDVNLHFFSILLAAATWPSAALWFSLSLDLARDGEPVEPFPE